MSGEPLELLQARLEAERKMMFREEEQEVLETLRSVVRENEKLFAVEERLASVWRPLSVIQEVLLHLMRVFVQEQAAGDAVTEQAAEWRAEAAATGSAGASSADGLMMGGEARQVRQVRQIKQQMEDCYWKMLALTRQQFTFQAEEVPDLPVLVLLKVFSFLPSRDLLRGPRGVSCQWREAALQPCLWKHRRLSSNDGLGVLRLGFLFLPAAGELYLQVSEMTAALWETATASECSFTKISVSAAYTTDGMDVAACVTFLRHQVELGQLRCLTLYSWCEEGTDELMSVLLNGGLSELTIYDKIRWNPEQVWTPTCHLESHASLKRLTLAIYKESPIAELLIQTHCSTLRSVSFPWGRASKRALRLLGGCPLLEEAGVPFIMEINHLSDCLLLRSLSIQGRIKEGFEVPVEYFQGAAQQLEKLQLWGYRIYEETLVVDNQVELLEALALSGQSVLADLAIFSLTEEDVAALPSILRGLPHLHTLQLGGRWPEELLDCISPGTCPSLRILRHLGVSVAMCTKSCSYPALYRLVKRNPLLHVTGLKSSHECKCTDKGNRKPGDCDCCDQPLHYLSKSGTDEIAMCGHSPSVHCGLHVHRGDEFWIWVRENGVN